MSVGKIILCVLAGIILLIIILMNHPIKIRIGYIDKKLILKVDYLFLHIYPRPKKKKKGRKGKKDDTIEDIDFDIIDDEDFADEKDDTAESEAQPALQSAESEPQAEESITEAIPEEEILQESKNEDNRPVEDGKDDAEKEPENDKKDSNTEKPSVKEGEKPKRPKKKKEPEKEYLADKIMNALDKLSQIKDVVMLVIDLLWADVVKFLSKIYYTGLYIDLEIAHDDAAKAATAYGCVNWAVYRAIGFIQSIATMKVKSVTIDCLYNTPSSECKLDGEITVRFRPQSFLNMCYFILFKFLFHMKKYKPLVNFILKKEN